MADRTGIEWTDATWNPVRGCSRVSEGCKHCYAERVAARFSGPGQPYEGLIHPSTKGWNGKVRLVPEALAIPWRWTRPRRIFVNSMSDLFHPEVPFEFVAAVFWIMSVTTRHTYQVLTKRPERMLEFFKWLAVYGDDDSREHGEFMMETSRFIGRDQFTDLEWQMGDAIYDAGHKIPEVAALPWLPTRGGRGGYDNCGPGWPLINVWLGVSVEDQAAADQRIPLLLQCPAAVRWISAEPLLGPLNFRWAPYAHQATGQTYREYLGRTGSVNEYEALRKLNWVVAGGESGPGARPMHPDWARSLRDQCAAAGVPFLFKQWGEWGPIHAPLREGVALDPIGIDGDTPMLVDTSDPCGGLARRGKKAAGRHLDGVLHDGYPEVTR